MGERNREKKEVVDKGEEEEGGRKEEEEEERRRRRWRGGVGKGGAKEGLINSLGNGAKKKREPERISFLPTLKSLLFP